MGFEYNFLPLCVGGWGVWVCVSIGTLHVYVSTPVTTISPICESIIVITVFNKVPSLEH